MNSSGEPIERFLMLFENVGHKGEDMEQCVLDALEMFHLPLENCRGQSYDNAANMTGQFNGLQARIINHNPLAVFVPCSAHSLNLVGACASECCLKVSKFFMFVQNIYNFFSASTNRWEIMKNHMVGKCTIPKKLSDTRWSARYSSCKALKEGLFYFKAALEEISTSTLQKPLVKIEADTLSQQLSKFENCLLIEIWTDFLERINAVSKSLQKINTNIIIAVELYDSLIKFFGEKRNEKTFKEYELKAETVAQSTYEQVRVSKRRRFFEESNENETYFEPSNDFKINVYYFVIDRLVEELRKRESSIKASVEKFNFLFCLEKCDSTQIKDGCTILKETYKNDLENFGNECIHFKCLISKLKFSEEDNKAVVMLKYIIENEIESTYPNIYVVLRIFLTIPISNCTGERSFSTLKRVKNCLRSTLGQSKLNNLMFLSIENDLLDKLDTEALIDNFARTKARKAYL